MPPLPGYPVDLHTHSIRSDGVHDPAELVRLAAERGVKVLALSDHDTLSGAAEAVAAGERLGMRVIPAIELNTESAWGDVHVLGYFLDPNDLALEERLRWLRENRGRRIELMVERLNALGYAIRLERVLEIAAGGALGRPHLAQALAEAGSVSSYDEAFRTLISKDSPAYVERVGLTPTEAVRLIVERGGVPSLAHPGTVKSPRSPLRGSGAPSPHRGPHPWGPDVSGLRELLPELVDAGLAGMEVYYPSHEAGFVADLRALAVAFELVPTGGSDYHGRGESHGQLGGAYVPADSVARLERSARPGGRAMGSVSWS